MIQLKTGIRYIVTKASVNGEFRAGDHIRVKYNGDIVCAEAPGFIEACDVPAATTGIEVEIDQRWAQTRRDKLYAELRDLG